MKKTVFVFLVVFMAMSPVFIMANGSQDTAAEDGKIKLSMYNYRDKTAANAEEFDILLESFYEANPRIEFEIEELFNEPWHQKLQAMAVSGQLPDVVRLWPGKRTGYVTKQGLVRDLRPYLGDESKNFMSMAMSPQGPNGEIYELPMKVTVTHVVYTNERLLKELGLTYPKTIEEMYAQADVIKAAGYIPVAMANKDGWQMQSCFLSTLVERTAGMKWFDGAITGKNAFTDPEFVDALKVIRDFSDKEMFAPGINQMDYPQGTEMFAQEKAVYYIDGAWKIEEFVNLLSEDQKDYISLNVIPELPNEKGLAGSTSAVAGTGFAMNAKLQGEEADAAWAWIWHYSGPVGSRLHFETGVIPAYKVDSSDLTLDKMIQKQFEFQSKVPMGYVIDNAMDGEGMGILHPAIQEMMFGSKSPEQVAQEYETWVAANDSGRK